MATTTPPPPFPPAGDKPRATLLAAFEVAFLDLQGQLTGRPVCDLLGGRVRDGVPFNAYLFYRFAAHRDDPDPADNWGEALTHEQVVAQARRMVEQYGFGSLKLKASVFDPAFEIETLRHLRRAFPAHPLRIDPNGA